MDHCKTFDSKHTWHSRSQHYNVTSKRHFLRSIFKLYRTWRDTAAAKLAAQYDVTYVPIPYTRTANDGHPTVSGHKYIGRQILKAVNH